MIARGMRYAEASSRVRVRLGGSGSVSCTTKIHVTSVFVTHDQEEAFEVADQIVVMQRDGIEHFGTPEEVFDRPASSPLKARARRRQQARGDTRRR